MSEFDLIARLKDSFGANAEGSRWPAALGIGDDAALLNVPSGMQLVVSTDTLVSGVHFLESTASRDIAIKALGVNLSDLAAMGATPAWFFLSITLPSQQQDWWDGFTEGLLEAAKSAAIQLAGGDTTHGPLSITVTVMGLVPAGKALCRGGAKTGDLVIVSGQTGLAAFALRQRLNGLAECPDASKALDRPEPRLLLGQALLGKASACIDVSDGLAADLQHVLRASGSGAELQLRDLPRPKALDEISEEDRWRLQLGGGDDYELCFTLPASYGAELAAIERQAGVKLSVIGTITENKELRLIKPDGGIFLLEKPGYEHFSTGAMEA